MGITSRQEEVYFLSNGSCSIYFRHLYPLFQSSSDCLVFENSNSSFSFRATPLRRFNLLSILLSSYVLLVVELPETTWSSNVFLTCVSPFILSCNFLLLIHPVDTTCHDDFLNFNSSGFVVSTSLFCFF